LKAGTDAGQSLGIFSQGPVPPLSAFAPYPLQLSFELKPPGRHTLVWILESSSSTSELLEIIICSKHWLPRYVELLKVM